MKTTRLLLIAATVITAGCATSLAPSGNFNDWTDPVAYRHHQPERASALASIQSQADKDGAEGE